MTMPDASSVKLLTLSKVDSLAVDFDFCFTFLPRFAALSEVVSFSALSAWTCFRSVVDDLRILCGFLNRESTEETVLKRHQCPHPQTQT